MDSATPARRSLPILLVAVLACGPPDPSAGTQAESGSETDASETGDGVEIPSLEWQVIATTCGTAQAVLPLDTDDFVVAGSFAVTSGWLRRYDAGGDESWLAMGGDPFVDVDRGPASSLWVAASQWGDSASIVAYDLDGQPLPSAPVLALPIDTRLETLTKTGSTWLLGGRVGAFPEDALVVQIDASGQTIAEFDAPSGNGNVASRVQSSAADGDRSAACGTAGEGESGVPWLLIIDGDATHELTGDGTGGLGVRSCVDVAVRGDRIARAERGDIDTLVVTDHLGAPQWTAPEDDLAVVAFAANGDVLGAGDSWMRRYTADGEVIWTRSLDVPELSVRDLAVLDTGAIIIVGNLPGDVGECAQAWIARYSV